MAAHIYKGKGTNSSNILFTIDSTYLFKGKSTNSSDILRTISGNIPRLFLIIL